MKPILSFPTKVLYDTAEQFEGTHNKKFDNFILNLTPSVHHGNCGEYGIWHSLLTTFPNRLSINLDTILITLPGDIVLNRNKFGDMLNHAYTLSTVLSVTTGEPHWDLKFIIKNSYDASPSYGIDVIRLWATFYLLKHSWVKKAVNIYARTVLDKVDSNDIFTIDYLIDCLCINNSIDKTSIKHGYNYSLQDTILNRLVTLINVALSSSEMQNIMSKMQTTLNNK